MIPSTRHGYARALSLSCGSASISTCPGQPFSSFIASIPHAESSAQAIRRAAVIQRSRVSASSLGPGRDGKGKGKAVDRGFECSGVLVRRWYATAVALRMEEDDKLPEVWDESLRLEPALPQLGAGSIPAHDWPDDPGFPYHRHRVQDTSRPISTTKAWPAVDLTKEGTIRAPTAEDNPLQPFPSASTSPIDRERFQARFTQLATSQPLLAFISLHSIGREAWDSLEAEHFDRLFRALIALHADATERVAQKRLFYRMDPAQVRQVLRWMRGRMLALPSRMRGKEGYTPGTRFRGRRLADYLSVCVLFRQEELAKEGFVRFFVPQIKAEQCPIQDLERYLSFLRGLGEWQVLVDSVTHDLFPSKRMNLPGKYWTSSIFSVVAEAYIHLGIPASVVKVAEEYRAAGGEMTVGCFTRLVQAQVALGLHTEAKRTRKEARTDLGPSSDLDFQVKLAILIGQRRMGFDKDLEEAVMRDIGRHTNLQAGRMIHALIRLRLDNGDTFGALALLDRFDLNAPAGSTPRTTRLTPVHGTIALAFEIIGRRPTMDQLEPWWNYFLANPTKINDRMAAVVVQSLSVLGKTDEAYEMVRSAVLNLEPASRIWRLPKTVEIGMRTINALTQCLARKHGLKGLNIATDLLRQADIRADGDTLQIIIDTVRSNMEAHPNDLAEMLKAMLDRATNVRAQIGHVDSIFAEAVKLASQRRSGILARQAVKATNQLRDPAAGLLPVDKFANTIDSILDSLRARAVQSSSMSLATRLRFEALVGSHVGRLPAAQAVCDEVIELGYKLSSRHLMALMRGYVDAGEMDQAESVVDLGRLHGIKTNRGMLMILIRGHIRNNAPRRAASAYRRIRQLGLDDLKADRDVIAATEMIRAHCRSRHYTQAAKLVRADLLREGVKLDDKAILVGITALRWVSQEVESLELLDRRKSPTLNYQLRSAVRSLQLHLKRKVEQGRSTTKEQYAVIRVQEILDADVRSRPYIARGSLFSKKMDDRVPRWYNAGGRPKLRQGHGAEFAGLIAPRDAVALIREKVLDGEKADRVRGLVEQRRLELEAELFERYKDASVPGRKVGELTAREKGMVDDEIEIYREKLISDTRRGKRLVAVGGRAKVTIKKSGSKAKGRGRVVSEWRRNVRAGKVRVSNPDGREETRLRTEMAAFRRDKRRREGVRRAEMVRERMERRLGKVDGVEVGKGEGQGKDRGMRKGKGKSKERGRAEGKGEGKDGVEESEKVVETYVRVPGT